MNFLKSIVFFSIGITSPAIVKSQSNHTWAVLGSGYSPRQLVVDAADNIYAINDQGTISKVTPSGVVTQAWASLAYSYAIYGAAIDASGNIYIANNNFISKITASGVVTQLWGSLNATISGIVTDPLGNVYVSTYNSAISKISPSGTVTSPWVTLGSNSYPGALAIDGSGNLYTSCSNNTVNKITASGVVTLAWATLAPNTNPGKITVAASGNIYTANDNNTISKITPSGTLTQAWASTGGNSTLSIVTDAAENVYVANFASDNVRKINSAGNEVSTWTLLTTDQPTAMVLDAAGNIYTSNNAHFSISKIGNTVPLPLELIGFKAIAEEGFVALKWKTSSEVNTSYFKVQRSFDGIDFETVGTVKALGNGNNNYAFNDDIKSLKATAIYYRLQISDLDGKATYSKIESVTFAAAYSSYSVYPNPLMGNSFTVNAGNNILPTGYALYNLAGKAVQQGILITKQTLINMGSLPSGTYFMKLNNRYETKIIKP